MKNSEEKTPGVLIRECKLLVLWVFLLKSIGTTTIIEDTKVKGQAEMKKLITLFVFLIAFVTVAYALPEANPTVRVGLYYGNDAMPSANLQNIEGVGYRFGFFDSAHTFIEQYSTTATNRISMLKDANMYYYDGKFYESSQPSGSKFIGAYHLELAQSYGSVAEVSAEVASLNLKGVKAFPAYVDGMYKIRIDSFADAVTAQSAVTKYMQLGMLTPVGGKAKCFTVVNTADGTILFEYDNGVDLAVYPSLGEVSVPLTWFKGYKYYGGFQYIRDNGNISVINFVPMQQYVMGVVPYEMSPNWPLEALKAQAICARTYALYNYGKHGKNFDICATTDCQVYSGANSANENSDSAVNQTYGQYILYDGKPINAVFHSSDGGATENSENVWSATLPYLRGVYDPHEDLDSAINGRWSYEYTPEELTYILNAKGYDAALIADMYVKEYTEMGNVKTLTLVDINGKQFNFSKEKARTILYSSTYKKYTHSQRYKVTKNGAASDGASLFINNGGSFANFNFDSLFAVGSNGAVSPVSNESVTILTASGKTEFKAKNTTAPVVGKTTFLVSGTGWGHNVGLSQNGAKAMANKGFSAENIIKFYYTDIELYTAS